MPGMPTTTTRSRWKFSFRRPSSSSSISAPTPTPPVSFLCPISSSLMYDPVILPTGQTFDRVCIQACRDLNFIPPPSSSSSTLPNPDSSSSSCFLIPNAALKSAIIDWCDRHSLPHPSPISHQSARAFVRNLIFTTPNPNPPTILPPKLKEEEEEDAQKEEEKEGDHYYSTINNQPNSPISSSSSSYSFPSTSSLSSSSELNNHSLIPNSNSNSNSSSLHHDTKTLNTTTMTAAAAANSSSLHHNTKTLNTTTMAAAADDPSEDSILMNLSSPQISAKESGLITLRQSARDSAHCRASLCTPTILAALLPIIRSNNTTLRVNATAAIVNLSIDPPPNKVKIVRSGAVPILVEALKSASRSSPVAAAAEEEEEQVRYNAAGALFSLALEDENKLALGVLGAIPPLVNLFSQQSASHVARREAGMALYHLSLAPNNLSKIAKTPGAVKSILNIATSRVGTTATTPPPKAKQGREGEAAAASSLLRLRRVAMMVLASLARRSEGRVALMDADAVKPIVGLMTMEEVVEEGDGEEQGSPLINTSSSSSNNNIIRNNRKEEEYCLGVLYEMSKGSLRFRALARAAGAERVLSAIAATPHCHHHQQQETSTAARGEVAKEMARRILKVIRGDHGEKRLLRDKKAQAYDNADDDEDGEIGSVVSDGLVSFRRRFDDLVATSASNSADF